MPNWCFTTYEILGDQENLDKIEKMLDELKSLDKPRVENGFGNLWLGCIVDYLGGDWQSISCRGDVTDYRRDKDSVTMYVETAWAESPEFRHFLADKFNVSVYHISEEPGMGLYWTNDIDGSIFHTKYFLDLEHDDVDPEYFADIEGVANYLNENNLLGFEVKPDYESIVKVLDEWNEDEEHEDQYIALHEFEYDDD